ncbi:hypothetical protein QAD02_017616 [Eretmocerus hayati]|uniref:Uncharacterized protein n=1 Tax=Eretmocerus hayati TaxID=131215 RepID=A0ACC2PEU0_9HYME|nr:hypothetical protein QAD02_017616 [Eretmocerus hayati]
MSQIRELEEIIPSWFRAYARASVYMVKETKFYDGEERVGRPQLLATWKFRSPQVMYMRATDLEQRQTDFHRGLAKNYIATLQRAKVDLLIPWMPSSSFTFAHVVNDL